MNPHYKYNIDHANMGDNAIASAAYQHRTQLRDESEPDPDKRYKSSNTHSEDIKRERILIPENNPPELYERAEKAKTDKEENDKLIEHLLNKLNKKRANRYTVHGILAHQPEMSDEQNYEAVELFAKRLALDYNCLFIYATHTEKHENRNIHSHYIASLFPLEDGEFSTKTKRIYIDENNNILKKVDTPVLKNGQLQYYEDGITYKTKKGWQELDLDKNGNIQYDDNGHVRLKDIRTPLLDKNGNRIYYKNGKYLKSDFKHIKFKKTEMEKRGSAKRTRILWQDCINEIARKYNVKDNNGKLFQVDLRSLVEQDADKPISQKRIPRKKIGPYKNKKALEYNSWAERIEKNEKIEENIPFDDLQKIYEIRRQAIVLENRLAELQQQKKFSYKAKKTFTDLSEKASGIFNKFSKKLKKDKQSKPKTYEDQMEFYERINNVEFYLSHPNILKYKAEDRAKKANQIIENDNAWQTHTKEKYYEISDTTKTFKELLIVKMLKKLPKNQDFEYVDNLKSKEFETLAKNLGLKKDFANYEKWLRASQEYYKNLPATEKAKPSRPAYLSKSFISTQTASTITAADNPTKTGRTGTSYTRPKKGKSVLPDTGKDPSINMKWKEKENHKLSEMEKADKAIDDWAEEMRNTTVLPPDPHKKDNEHKI